MVSDFVLIYQYLIYQKFTSNKTVKAKNWFGEGRKLLFHEKLESMKKKVNRKKYHRQSQRWELSEKLGKGSSITPKR